MEGPTPEPYRQLVEGVFVVGIKSCVDLAPFNHLEGASIYDRGR